MRSSGLVPVCKFSSVCGVVDPIDRSSACQSSVLIRPFGLMPRSSSAAVSTQNLRWRIFMFTKLLAGSFLSLGLVAMTAFAGSEKPKDCCSAKLACCTTKSACCEAKSRPGCCEKGQQCCVDNKACCAAVQKCCTEGMACCDEAKACCGPAKTANTTARCCTSKPAA
jgi:hypothetical protein